MNEWMNESIFFSAVLLPPLPTLLIVSSFSACWFSCLSLFLSHLIFLPAPLPDLVWHVHFRVHSFFPLSSIAAAHTQVAALLLFIAVLYPSLCNLSLFCFSPSLSLHSFSFVCFPACSSLSFIFQFFDAVCFAFLPLFSSVVRRFIFSSWFLVSFLLNSSEVRSFLLDWMVPRCPIRRQLSSQLLPRSILYLVLLSLGPKDDIIGKFTATRKLVMSLSLSCLRGYSLPADLLIFFLPLFSLIVVWCWFLWPALFCCDWY